MDKKKRQAEEEEYEKKKALQREKVQAKKLSTSYFFIAFLQGIVLLSCICKTSYGHLACVCIQCFFMIPL